MTQFNEVTDSRYGRFVYNVNDRYVGRSIAEYGEYGQGEVALLSRLIVPGDIVLDVGANMGALTLPIARMGAIVYAFEPQRMMFQLLCANMAINSIVNVFAFNEAIGATEGEVFPMELDPTVEQNFGGLSLDMPSKVRSIAIRQRTIDSLKLASVKVIKVDVEGMERDVLEGAYETIRSCRPVLYVENDRLEKSQALMEYLSLLGYEYQAHRPPLFNANNYRHNDNNVFPNVVSINMVCIHRDDMESKKRLS